MAFAYAPQYVIVAIPFIIFCIMIDEGYRLCWWLIGIGAFISALALNNFSLLSSISAYWNIIPADAIINMMNAFEVSVLGLSLESVLNALGFVLEYAGLVLVILIALEKELVGRYPSMSSFFERIRRRQDA